MITTIEAYVAAVQQALGPGRHDAELAELHSQLGELAQTYGEAGACQLLGDPTAYAAGLRGDHVGQGGRASDGDVPHVLGVPFTAFNDPRRGLHRMFDPTNPKVLVPKVMGFGWTINWGAVAVKLRLLRPDDVDAGVLRRVRLTDVALGCAVPVALALAGLLLAAWGAAHLQLVPNHWATGGRPDRWGPANKVLWPSIIAATLMGGILAVAALVLARLRRAALALGALAFSTVITGFGFIATLARVTPTSSFVPLWLFGALLSLLCALLVAVLPLRSALRRTWREPGALSGGMR